MKKLLLLLTGGLMISAASYAQTHSILANNRPNGTSTSYIFDFNGTSDNNCFAGGGVAYDPMPANQTWSITTDDDSLTVVVPTMAAYDDSRQRAHFYTGDCVASAIDLSAAGNQKLELSFTATEPGQLLIIFYSGATTNYSAPGLDVINFTAGTNTYNVTTLDLTGISAVNQANITDIGLFARGTTGWGDFSFDGTIKIDYILVGGDQTLKLASNNDKVDVSASISVFPNPASDKFTVDMNDATLEGPAVIKMINSTGVEVYSTTTTASSEEISASQFEKGLYVIQVVSGNKVASKKVVVE